MTNAIDFLEGYLKGRGRMKAEDTVIRGEKLVPYVFKDKGGYRTPFSIAEKLAKAQAEISFKAGYEERDKWLSPDETDRLEKARMAGIKEVVKWLRKYSYLGRYEFTEGGLKKKLKEWGIE